MPHTVELDGNRCCVRIVHGNCIEGMATLPAGCVDAIVTSPPYNIGVRYGSSYDDTAPRDEYLAWIGRWAETVQRVLAPEGSLFLVVGSKPTDPWVPFQVAQVVGRHFVLQNVIHWVKSVAIHRDSEFEIGNSGTEIANPEFRTPNSEFRVLGHYKPVNSPRFLNQAHEYVFHFTKTGQVALDRLSIGVPYQDKSNVTRWKAPRLRASQSQTPKPGFRIPNSDLHCRGNVWFIPYETIQRRERDRPHPATFPPRLAEMCLRLHGLERVRLVLDPFMGIGNTAVACAQLSLDFLGFEIEEDYVPVAEQRLRESVRLSEKTTE